MGNVTMEHIFTIFMAFIGIVCLFSVLVVVRDIVKDMCETARENRKAKELENGVNTCCKEKVPATPVVAKVEKQEEIAVTVDKKVEKEIPEGAVTFSAGKELTLDDKYHALSSNDKNYYDDIIKYASAVEGSKRYKNTRYEEYKSGTSRIVRLVIKRGVIHCEFIMQNMNFKNYVAQNKVSVKQSATVIKVTGAETVQTVKDTIDIAVRAIAEEREFKKQLAREKRRIKREEQK